MDYRYTRHQVARGTRPDAVKDTRLFLVKATSVLHATYQIRLLAFMAHEQGKQLVLQVLPNTELGPSLKKLRREHPKLIIVERK